MNVYEMASVLDSNPTLKAFMKEAIELKLNSEQIQELINAIDALSNR